MPRPARHPAGPEMTVSRIVKAAQEEMLASGLAGATIDAVAARARASKQTIYSLFPAKDDLFRAAIRLTVAEASEADRPDTAALSCEQALVEFARWVQRSSRRPANLGLYRANIAVATAAPELATDLHQLRLGASPLVGLMESLQRDGRVPRDRDPAGLANWFGVLSIGGLRDLIGVTPSRGWDDARIAALVHLFARGWRSPASPVVAPPVDAVQRSVARVDPRGGRTSPERWIKILRLAAESLRLKGIRGMAIDELAAASGVAKMTIYRRYGSKEKLVEAALHQAVADLVASPLHVPLQGRIDEDLTNLAFDYDRKFSRPGQVKLLRLLVAEAPTRPALASGIWQQLIVDDHRRLAAHFAALQASGELHLTDPAIAAEQFLLLASRGNRRLTDPIGWNETEARRHAADVVAFCLRSG